MPTFRTSGTTGVPKSFEMSDASISLRGQLSDANRGTGFAALKHLFVDFSPASVVGVNYQRYGELNPAVTVSFASAAQGTTEATVQLFKDQGIDGIISTPNGLLNYAHAINGTHQFAWIGSVTQRLTPAVITGLRSFGVGTNIWSWYATSETGAIALANADQIVQNPNCVGIVLPGVTIDFDNGEIIVKSDLTISGYSDAEHNPSKFRNGFYYTGDLGHMDGNLLIMTGRKPA